MAGFDNDVGNWIGERLEPSTAQAIGIAQQTNSVSKLNVSGSPEGVVSANPASLAHDRSSGNIYQKVSGTGNTGWVLLTNADTDLYVSPYIVDAAGGPGSSFTTIQAAVTQAIADGVSVANIYIRPAIYTENITLSTAGQFNFVGIGNTNALTSSYQPFLNGTLTIDNGAFTTTATVSAMRVSTVSCTKNVIFLCSNASITTYNGTTGVIYGDSSEIGTVNQNNAQNSIFFNCEFPLAINVSAGGVIVNNCNVVGLVTMSGTGAFFARNSNITGMTGTTSGSVFLGSCVTAGNTYNLSSQISITDSLQGNMLLSRDVSSSDNVLTGDYLINVDSSGGAVTLTVPAGLRIKNKSFVVKDVGGSAASNNITITPTGKTIDGVASKVISSAYGALTIFYNGTNFFTL